MSCEDIEKKEGAAASGSGPLFQIKKPVRLDQSTQTWMEGLAFVPG